MAAKMMASLATCTIARPPARLATISSSCCSWARASTGDALKAPNKRKNVIRHTNAARRNMEYLRRTLARGVGLSPNESPPKNLTPHHTCGQQEPPLTHYHNRKPRRALLSRTLHSNAYLPPPFPSLSH